MTVFDEIEAQLGDGWGVTLISTITPGVVRLQLCGKGEMDEARYCAEGATLAEAIQAAIKFTRDNPYKDYEKTFWHNMEHAFDGPGCDCPQCQKELSFGDEDDYCTIANDFSQFRCIRCGTISVWDLTAPFPLLAKKDAEPSPALP